MSVPYPSQLGPYEIVGFVGAGGMGDVYRSRDRRLSREVAVKVLPKDVLRDSDGFARFGPEADWAPDGETLAVGRDVDGKTRLEMPIGTVLFVTDG